MLTLLLALLLPAQAQSWTSVASGVDVAQWTTSDPLQISALRVSLCTPGVSMRATTSSERGQITSSWAGSTSGVVAAVNGGFFTTGYAPDAGRAAGAGSEWSDSTDTSVRGFVGFGEHQLGWSAASEVAGLESWMEEVVNGDATLVEGGAAVDCGGCGSGKHPRTAVGASADEQTLYMVAVDGRSSSSEGITIDDLAVLMRDIGAYRAMNLDGGGSTTLWTSTGGVLNDPSDGSERTVGNHLGVVSAGSGLRYNCPVGWAGTWAGHSFEGASGSTITAPAGSRIWGSFSIANSGTKTWDTELTRLAPLPRDVASAVAAEDWIAGHRVVAVDAATAPGETGTFTFSFEMPEEVGSTTRFEFALLQEAESWFAESWGPADGTWYLDLVTTEALPEDTADPTDDTGGGGVGGDSGDDGGSGEDGGTAGEEQKGSRSPGEDDEAGGCGCQAVKASSVGWLGLGLGLLLVARRRG